MTRPCISVCIANYNGERLLADCIDSLLVQQVQADLEILVHDDASQDGSLVLLAAAYPQVRVIASLDNVGFCASNNRMAAQARGEYLLLLNNDAALDADALSVLLAEAMRIGGDAILTLPQHDWVSGALVDYGSLLDPFCNPVPNLVPGRSDVAFVVGACMWIPRRLFKQLGGFPAHFGSLAEDMYLCSVARLQGLPVRCVGGSRYRHRQGTSFGGNRADKGLMTTYGRRALSERNKTWAMLSCTPGWVVWPLVTLHLLLIHVEGALVSLWRRDARLWRQVYHPILPVLKASREQWLAQRRELQCRRLISQRQWWSAFVLMPYKLVMLWRLGMPRFRQ